MDVKSIPAQIIDVIKSEDCENITNLFNSHPEYLTFFTPFGGQTWLGYAAQLGKLAAVKVLIKLGIDVNIGDRFDDGKPICSAAANNHYEVVEYLLTQGAILDVSLSVRNPLFAAIVGRSPQIVSLLLNAGIDSTVRYDSPTMRNMDAVAFALMRGETECAELVALWNAKGDSVVAAAALLEADSIAEDNAR